MPNFNLRVQTLWISKTREVMQTNRSYHRPRTGPLDLDLRQPALPIARLILEKDEFVIPRPSLPSVFVLVLNQHLDRLSEEFSIDTRYDVRLQFVNRLAAPFLVFWRHVILPPRRDGVRTRAKHGNVRHVQFQFFQQGICAHELRFRLSRHSDDDVGGDAHVRHALPDACDEGAVIVHRIAAFHSLEHEVVARLPRYFDVLAYLGQR